MLDGLQHMAWQCLREKKTIQLDELPITYHKEAMRIDLKGAGVCGCLRCDKNKLLSYWMRRRQKRTGRPIDEKYRPK